MRDKVANRPTPKWVIKSRWNGTYPLTDVAIAGLHGRYDKPWPGKSNWWA